MPTPDLARGLSGERGAACGFCDICDGTHTMFNGVVAAQKAMSALLRTSGRFFPGHLANILIGKATEAVSRHRHDDLPTLRGRRRVRRRGMAEHFPTDPGGRAHRAR